MDEIELGQTFLLILRNTREREREREMLVSLVMVDSPSDADYSECGGIFSRSIILRYDELQ